MRKHDRQMTARAVAAAPWANVPRTSVLGGALLGGAVLGSIVLGAAPAWAAKIPRDAGYARVKIECTRCHRLDNIVQSEGFTAPDWRDFVVEMTDLERRPAVLEEIVGYLARNFPPDD
ncbi:hypothetical protein [Phaeovulum vinaykumarii]|uniref:Quinohemoprotein amine dehydrogenase alpha subunit haem binding domain-containing protein n=1 Tax=Phaeovulum vinaykumarii TaxID=407234 RepID=A0A1N7LMC6_9RHOB|nr:hypothetical protein [Phaeovulum vinaykumarii]SIS75005.1 hypothetical protein SAMN05421795_103248 [Phaeovulum vinaykumarii]SOC05426.1 hypothetical protein SAMN05878426_103248 [Phaeovulum vinaykumarii]